MLFSSNAIRMAMYLTERKLESVGHLHGAGVDVTNCNGRIQVQYLGSAMSCYDSEKEMDRAILEAMDLAVTGNLLAGRKVWTTEDYSAQEKTYLRSGAKIVRVCDWGRDGGQHRKGNATRGF